MDRYLEKFNIDNVKTVSLIPSKKNSVYLIKTAQKDYILKVYKLFGQKGFKREMNILRKVSPPLIPLVFASYKREAILIEYIEGKRIFDLQKEELTTKIIDRLIQWFYKFHLSLPGYIRGDSIPQNFIIKKDGSILGIDFEEAKRGDILLDIVEFSAFLLAWKRLKYEQRKDLAGYLISSWQRLMPYDIKPFLTIYFTKFFRKFYFFRKDKTILDFIQNIDEIVEIMLKF